MSPLGPWQRLESRVAHRLLVHATALLPKPQQHWGDAILAEAESRDPPRPLGLAISGVVGIARIAAAEAFRGHLANPRMVFGSLILGFGTAGLDLVASNRWPLRIVLLAGSMTLGALVPAAAWRWGLLAALGLPLLVLLTGFTGPYAYDRGDLWLPLLPCVLVSTLSGALAHAARRRLRPHGF